jgi:hypothetical protein
MDSGVLKFYLDKVIGANKMIFCQVSVIKRGEREAEKEGGIGMTGKAARPEIVMVGTGAVVVVGIGIGIGIEIMSMVEIENMDGTGTVIGTDTEDRSKGSQLSPLVVLALYVDGKDAIRYEFWLLSFDMKFGFTWYFCLIRNFKIPAPM